MNAKPLILIIEDETDLITLLSYNLEKEGFAVISAEEGMSGFALAEKERPDLIILDWMLPDTTGIDVCRLLRRSNVMSKAPIIMLTARGEEHDRIKGLNAGADDYVTKPFSPAELVARIKAVLRRSEGSKPVSDVLEVGDLSMDLVAHRVSRNKVELE